MSTIALRRMDIPDSIDLSPESIGKNDDLWPYLKLCTILGKAERQPFNPGYVEQYKRHRQCECDRAERRGRAKPLALISAVAVVVGVLSIVALKLWATDGSLYRFVCGLMFLYSIATLVICFFARFFGYYESHWIRESVAEATLSYEACKLTALVTKEWPEVELHVERLDAADPDESLGDSFLVVVYQHKKRQRVCCKEWHLAQWTRESINAT